MDFELWGLWIFFLDSLFYIHQLLLLRTILYGLLNLQRTKFSSLWVFLSLWRTFFGRVAHRCLMKCCAILLEFLEKDIQFDPKVSIFLIFLDNIISGLQIGVAGYFGQIFLYSLNLMFCQLEFFMLVIRGVLYPKRSSGPLASTSVFLLT